MTRTIIAPAGGGTAGGGTGDVVGPAASVDSEVALFSGVTGKLLKRSTGTGVTRITSGVQSAAELSGDVTTSGSNVVTIANDAVTYAKQQNVSAASRLLGRGSASGSGDCEEITLGTNLTMTGTTLAASGGGSSALSSTRLTADATAVTGVTGIEVTGLNTTTGTGTFFFQYIIRYQTTVASTGIRFGVNHTGTVTVFLANLRFQALTGAPTAATQANASGTPVAISGVATRTRSTTTPNLGPTISVDTANADMLAFIEGLVVVTADGDLELWYNAELAALVAQVMAESSLILMKLS